MARTQLVVDDVADMHPVARTLLVDIPTGLVDAGVPGWTFPVIGLVAAMILWEPLFGEQS